MASAAAARVAGKAKAGRKPAPSRPAKRAAPGGGAVTLDDLTPAAREQLLREARGETAGDVSEQAALEQAAALEARRRSYLTPRKHLESCPLGEPDYQGDGRVEIYPSRKPPVTDRQTGMIKVGATDVAVAHCLTCGASTILEKPYDEVVAEINQDEGDPDG